MREGVPNTHAAPGPDLCCHHPTYLLTSTSSDRGKNAQIQMNIQYIEMYIYAATTLPTYLLPPLLKLFSQRKNTETQMKIQKTTSHLDTHFLKMIPQ